eukprot:scaffold168961_cov40-Tisochrysis_lutea.AAC.1
MACLTLTHFSFLISLIVPSAIGLSGIGDGGAEVSSPGKLCLCAIAYSYCAHSIIVYCVGCRALIISEDIVDGIAL